MRLCKRSLALSALQPRSPAVPLFAPAALLLAAFAPPASAPPASAEGPGKPPAAVAASPEVAGVVTIEAAPALAAPAPQVEPVWQPDLSSALALSARSGKPVLVVFGAEWCHYCHKQDDETLSDGGVKKTLAEGFVTVRLDFDKNRAAAEILGVEALPQVVFLAPNADLLGRAAGFHTPAQFGTLLSTATSNHSEAKAARAARIAAAPAKTATF